MKLKSILVSQPQPSDIEKSPYVELGKKHNIKVDFFKFIRIEGVESKEFRKERIHLQDYTALILTSRNAVDHYFRMAKELRFEVPETMKYFCLTESTAFYLQKYVQYRKRKIFHGKQDFAELYEIIKKHKTEKYLLPCSDVAKNDIPKMLDKGSITYHKAIIYRTVPADLTNIEIFKYDLIIFFSPMGIKSIFQSYPDFQQGEMLIGAVGPTTAKAVKDAGLTLNIQAPTKTSPSMTMALEEYILKACKKK
ncbi:MAG: uroporphyrinogen-III synthase [Bacteroidetes bacterium]|nr:uroporphyrinogen-III synthase [Bacteroidota bacterium]